jgi:Holliday junction DNA helicase RuvA
MIGWLSGAIVVKKPSSVIIDAGGVGYLVNISIPTFYSLPDPGHKTSLHIHTNVREDALALFGFPTAAELELFKKLIGVTKVGPKLAMNVMSGCPARELIAAVRGRDAARLSSIPGVGPKTADRIILDLVDKLEGLLDGGAEEPAAAGATSSVENDAVEALVSLGYKPQEARKAVKAAISIHPDAKLEGLIRAALARMA